ncbi:hypothetical protein N330_10059, partial [Leptosomus discolor]
IVSMRAWRKGPDLGSDSQHKNFNIELFKMSKPKSHLKSIFQLCSVTSWLGWFSSRVLAAGVREGISVLLLTDKLMLWCSCCVTVMSPGLAVVEACNLSALVPTMGVVRMKASSISV